MRRRIRWRGQHVTEGAESSENLVYLGNDYFSVTVTVRSMDETLKTAKPFDCESHSDGLWGLERS